MTSSRHRNHDGFTLIEILAVMAILGLFAALVGGVLVSTLSANAAFSKFEGRETAGRILTLMSRDCRGLYAVDTTRPALAAKSGALPSLDFVTTQNARRLRNGRASDITEVGYRLLDKEGRQVLSRREDFFVDDSPFAGGTLVRLAPVGKLTFSFHDGKDWTEEWDASRRKDLPRLVKIELETAEDPPARIVRVVYIPAEAPPAGPGAITP
ncbi:MAG: type II secretion system protein GspJ [Planctomycetota bacterium]